MSAFTNSEGKMESDEDTLSSNTYKINAVHIYPRNPDKAAFVSQNIEDKQDKF